MSDKIITKEYLEEYNKSLCNDVIKVVNDIVLNSPTTSSGCEYIDENSEGELTLHYKQVDQVTPPILESQFQNSTNNITLHGNLNIAEDLDLGETGILKTKSDGSAYIQDGVIDGFELQNCDIGDFVIIVRYNSLNQQYEFYDSTLTINDIIDAYDRKKSIILKIIEDSDSPLSSNVKIRYLELHNMSYMILESPINIALNTQIGGNVFIFYTAPDMYSTQSAFIIYDINDTLTCIPYSFENRDLIVEITIGDDALVRNYCTDYSNIKIKTPNDVVIDEWDNSVSDWDQYAAKSIQKFLDDNYNIRFKLVHYNNNTIDYSVYCQNFYNEYTNTIFIIEYLSNNTLISGIHVNQHVLSFQKNSLILPKPPQNNS